MDIVVVHVSSHGGFILRNVEFAANSALPLISVVIKSQFSVVVTSDFGVGSIVIFILFYDLILDFKVVSADRRAFGSVVLA